jgi:ribose/xylose/arabinose/galactoside ABC-type transport system permease subunit
MHARLSGELAAYVSGAPGVSRALERASLLRLRMRNPRRYAPFALLLLVALLTALVAPNFYDTRNLANVARTASPLAVLAIAQTLVLIVGGIDLSQAAVVQATTIALVALTAGSNAELTTVVPLVLCIGAVVGLANGLLSTYGRIPPFIATLAVGITVVGIRLVLTQGTATGSVPPAVRTIGGGTSFGLPNALFVPAAVAAAVFVVLAYTTTGRRLYAVGANIHAARASGIRVRRVVVTTYVVAGILSAVGGFLLAGYVGFAAQRIGAGVELDSIAAAVIGGATFAGGQGSVAGTIAGVALLALLVNVVLLVGLPTGAQLVVKALVIIGGLALYRSLRQLGTTSD